MKEEGHVLRVEDGGSRGVTLPKVNEDITPSVLWSLGLNLHMKCSQRIMGKCGEGNGEVDSGERCEEWKGRRRAKGSGHKAQGEGQGPVLKKQGLGSRAGTEDCKLGGEVKGQGWEAG